MESSASFSRESQPSHKMKQKNFRLNLDNDLKYLCQDRECCLTFLDQPESSQSRVLIVAHLISIFPQLPVRWMENSFAKNIPDSSTSHYSRLSITNVAGVQSNDATRRDSTLCDTYLFTLVKLNEHGIMYLLTCVITYVI